MAVDETMIGFTSSGNAVGVVGVACTFSLANMDAKHSFSAAAKSSGLIESLLLPISFIT